MSKSSQHFSSDHLQTILLNNALPLPSNFNGYDWQTIIPRSRKAMPSYLEQDLPPLKYHYIRQQFKSINKIQCPRLTYFQTKIAKSKGKSRHCQGQCSREKRRQDRSLAVELSQKRKKSKSKDPVVQSLKGQLHHLKKSLQFALITSERDSNVVNDLIQKSNTIQQQLYYRMAQTRKQQQKKQSMFTDILPRKKKRHNNSFKQQLRDERCFEDTIQLVIEARKHDLKQKIREQQQTKKDQNEKKDQDEKEESKEAEKPSESNENGIESIIRKIGQIQMLSFSNTEQVPTFLSKSENRSPILGKRQ